MLLRQSWKTGLNVCRFLSMSAIPPSRQRINEAIITDLRSLVKSENVTQNKDILVSHGKDEGHFPSVPPDVVVFAECREDVQKVLSYCNEHGFPVIPFGSGTGLEGGVNAMNGGVSIDVSKMNEIIEVNQDDFDCVVQPGVNWRDLNNYLRDTGLWFPVDPGASASLGGMASTGASGTNAVRYGTMKQNVLNLEVCLPNGSVISTSGLGTRTRKSSAGYHLTELFVGSEGTLGVVTQLTLRLRASPQVMSSAVCTFPDVSSAVNAAIETLQNDIPIARIELMDELSMEASSKYSKVDFLSSTSDSHFPAALFLEFHGPNEKHVLREIEAVKEIFAGNGNNNFTYETDPEERAKLWKARHELYYACLNLLPNSRGLVTDVCVPISNLTKMIQGAQELFKSTGVTGPIHGHVGDGNFHSILLYPRDADAESEAKIKETAERLGGLALSLGGTCTGEHGIGRGKMNMLVKQFGDSAIHVMRGIKSSLDPKGIMNPGKLFVP